MQSYQHQRASSSGGTQRNVEKLSFLKKLSFLLLWLVGSHAWAYSIQGTFVNIDGKGVAGVTVSAGSVTGSTDANGAFKLDGLAEGTYSVTASGSGYKTKTVAGLYVGDNMGQVTNMGARTLVATTNSYRVKVGAWELPANTVAKDATVQIGSLTGTLQPDNYYHINLSDTSGTVTVSKPGYNSLSRNFGVNDDSPVQTIAWFYLNQGGYKIKGRILDIDKNPVAGVQLSLNTGNSATSNADGTFVISSITNETYSMTFTGKLTGYKDVVRSGYYVDNNVREYPAGDIYMIKAVDGFRVMGCVSYDGNEMSNVQVTVGDKVVRTGTDGCYNIGLSNPGNYNYEIKVVEDVTLAGVSFKLPANSFLPKTGTVSLTEQQPTALPNSAYTPAMSTSAETASTGTRQRRDGLGVNPNPVLTQCGYLEQVVTITNKSDCPIGVWNLDLVSEPELPSYLDFVGGQQKVQYPAVQGGITVTLPIPHSTHPINFTGVNDGIGYKPTDYLPGIQTPLNCNLANDPATTPVDNMFPYPRSPFDSGNPSARILECRNLGLLYPSASTKVNVVIAPKCGGGSGGGTIPPFKLYFKAAGKTCKGSEVIDVDGGGMPRSRREGCRDIPSLPAAVVTVPEVLPNLNLTLPSATTQVRIAEGDLSYVLTVRNDATDKTVAKNVTVTIPNVPTTLATSYTTDKGTCTKTTTGSIQCRLQDLPSGAAATITLKLTPKQAPLTGSLAAQLTSQDTQETPQTVALNYTVLPALTECETNPTCDCTPKPAFCAGIPDLSIVFDDTGSMSEEINGLRKATTDFVTAIKAGQIAKPSIQLVTFKDNVSHRITTDVPDTLQYYVNSLAASGGADCPEFSSGALDWVVSNTTSNRLRDGGRILLVTDASPPHNADMDAVIKKLVQRGIKVDVLISGDACVADGVSQSTVDAYSQLANETHGYFAKVFEVNDGTAEGKKKYEDTARQVLFGAIFPTILGVDPNKAPQESTLNVNLTAANTNFNDNSTVTLQKGDKALVVNKPVKVISATELVANVTVPEGIDLGAYDVKIETKLGSTTEVATAKAMLEVTQPSLTPDILSITPTSAMQNYEVEVAISGAGTHFFTGLSRLSFEDDGILVKSLKIDSKNALTATLEISSTARLGMHAVTVTTGSEVAKSPKELFLVMQESLFAKLKEVTPHQGRQGGMVQVHLVGGNTNFEDGKSEIKFNGRGLTPLALTVQDATHATATLMMADNTPLGFQDVFVKTGDEVAVLLKGFEVLEKGCNTVEGYVLSQDGQGIADIYVAVAGQGMFTDATGFYRLTGLPEDEYTLTAEAKGYHFDPQTFYLGGQNACETSTGETANKVFTAVSNLAVKITMADHIGECVKQDGQVTYNVTVTNQGTQTATGVVLTDILPANTSLAALEGVNCNLDTASCALSDLGPNGVASVKVTLHNTQDQPLLNKVTVSSNEYPPATTTRWKCVAPHLSVSIKDTPDPVTMLGNLTYLFEVDLSQYAPTQATGVTFNTRLPQGVEFKSLKTPVGTCDTSQLPAISCDLGDFSVVQPTDVSHTTVTVETILKDAGLLLLTTEATVSAKEYVADLDRERTAIFVPPDIKVDLALVIDTTESMQGEINGVIRAIQKFLAKVDVSQHPSMVLVTFKDEVTVKAFTQNLDVLLGAVEDLTAEGGNTCPEASVEALNVAIQHLKDGGNLLFVTDASPYEDADVAGLETLIKGKNMTFNPIITGDCTTAGSWNELSK